MLQDYDTHLIYGEYTYEQRKDILMDYYIKRKKADGRLKQLRQPMKLLTPKKTAISA